MAGNIWPGTFGWKVVRRIWLESQAILLETRIFIRKGLEKTWLEKFGWKHLVGKLLEELGWKAKQFCWKPAFWLESC